MTIAHVSSVSPFSISKTVEMEVDSGLNNKQKVSTALEVAAVARDVAECVGVSGRTLGATRVISVIGFPFACSNFASHAGTLISGAPKEEMTLAAVGLGDSLGSIASGVGSTATGIYAIADATKGAWLSIIGSVAALLGIFGIAASGLSYHFTNRVTNQIDELLQDDGTERLANIETYLQKLQEEKSSYLSRHFNLSSEGSEKVNDLIKNALAGSDEEKVDLLASLKDRAVKKKNADARDLVIGAIAFIVFLALSFTPLGWVAMAVSIAAGVLYLANLAYRIKTSREPLMQMKPRVENDDIPSATALDLNPDHASVG